MPETVALIRGTLLDGSGREPVANAAVVIEGERVAQAGPAREVAVPRDARTIDVAGMTIMPGIIDCHVHMAGAAGYDLLRKLVTPPSLDLLYVVPNLQRTLEAGVTTVRDAGGTPAGVRMAIEQGIIAGPRMLTAVGFLTQTGGHADGMMPCCVDLRQAIWPDLPVGPVDGAEAVRRRTRELLRAGADWIKLCTSGGVLSPADAPSAAQFTVEEIAAAVYEAAAQGKRCMAHAQSTLGIKNAITAGVASIEHGIWLDDEAIAMMLERGVYLVPTLVAPRDVIAQAEEHPERLPAYAADKARLVAADHGESFRRAVEAGVKIAMGTDTGVGPHGGNLRELGLMVEHGMTPMQAIVASTRSAAELLHLDHDLGTLEPGKLADVLVVEDDPLADIHTLADPACLALVMKGGSLVKDRLSIVSA
jgi:imidazolonepropionase-like amidohydrolase